MHARGDKSSYGPSGCSNSRAGSSIDACMGGELPDDLSCALRASLLHWPDLSTVAWQDAVVGSAAVALDGLSTATGSAMHAVQRRGWQEISIGGEVGEEDDGDMEVFQLPGSCSPLVFQFLFTLTRELHCSGSHAVERSVLNTLRQRSGQALVKAFTQAVAQAKSQRGEKEGLVLQLLFDCRFASLILR